MNQNQDFQSNSRSEIHSGGLVTPHVQRMQYYTSQGGAAQHLAHFDTQNLSTSNTKNIFNYKRKDTANTQRLSSQSIHKQGVGPLKKLEPLHLNSPLDQIMTAFVATKSTTHQQGIGPLISKQHSPIRLVHKSKTNNRSSTEKFSQFSQENNLQEIQGNLQYKRNSNQGGIVSPPNQRVIYMPQIRPMSNYDHEYGYDLPTLTSGQVTSRDKVEETFKQRTVGLELSKIFENSQESVIVNQTSKQLSPQERSVNVSNDYSNSRSQSNSRSHYKRNLNILEPPQSNNKNNLTAILEQRHEESQQNTMTNFSCFIGSTLGQGMSFKGMNNTNNDQ